jgi:CheY-like chemotaxis protein
MPRILTLDDEPGLAALVADLLASVGYEYQATADSHEALAILRREPIDLLVQDCLRGDVDGLALYRLLKADPRLRSVPVLFFSAGVQPEETAALRSPYADGHLRKPATRQELVAAVAKVLSRAGKIAGGREMPPSLG